MEMEVVGSASVVGIFGLENPSEVITVVLFNFSFDTFLNKANRN